MATEQTINPPIWLDNIIRNLLGGYVQASYDILNDEYGYTDSISMTSSYQLIYDDLAVDGTDYIWVWADFNNLLIQWEPELDIVGVAS